MTDTKIVYAQSSDIKSRSFLEYKRDMKKKAIAEFETRDWLSGILSQKSGEKVIVRKSGGDAHIWFLRKGGVTGEADFEAIYKNKIEKYEFQYADSEEIEFFDFKVSKVGKKIHGEREAYYNKKFVYIVKSVNKYAFIEPSWIMAHGKEAGVPAWGNRTAFRVPHDIFVKILNDDSNLKNVVHTINIKTSMLNFAFEFMRLEEENLSHLLQSVIDKEEIVKFIPKSLESFYHVCFILDKINQIPVNANLWLMYVLSFFNDNMTSYKMAQLVYCIDFLYSKIELQNNELIQVVSTIRKIKEYCLLHQKADGRFETSVEIAPKEETRHLLFILNLLEDLTQDSVYYYKSDLEPVSFIFNDVKNLHLIAPIVEVKKIDLFNN